MSTYMTYGEWRAGSLNGSLSAYAVCFQHDRLCILQTENTSQVPDTQPVLCIDPETFQSPDQPVPVVNRLKALIDTHYAIHPQPNWYAGGLNMSLPKLNEHCRRSCGTNVSGLIQQKAINEAKRLLTCTGLSVKEITYQTGFGDPSNFAKVFKKITGQTPSAYRGSGGHAVKTS